MSKSLKSSILACILLLVLALSARATYVPYSPQNFNDELFWLYDNGDATKKLQFELDAITTGNTRTIIIGDADGDTADWNTAYGWGDHGSGGYLKADGSVTVTGAMTHNVGADTNYIELNPGAGNAATIDSNGELYLGAAEDIYAITGGGEDIYLCAGEDFVFCDVDAALAIRMFLDSATGNLTMMGTLAGVTKFTVSDDAYIGSASDTDAIQIEADGDVVLTQNLTVDGTFTDGVASLVGGSLTSVKLGTLTSNGFVKTNFDDGTLSVGAVLEEDIDHGGLGGLADDDHTHYLLADGTRTVTGAMAHTVGADTNYIELNPGAGNYAKLDSNGEMWLEAAEDIYAVTGGGKAINLCAGSNFLFCDVDAAYATRMILDSATGDLTIGGAIDVGSGEIDGVTIGTNSACTELQVDNININGSTINCESGNMTISAAGGSIDFSNDNIYTTGDAYVDELTLTNGQDYIFSRRGTNFLTLQSQTSNVACGFEVFSKDGDSQDDVTMTYWLIGTPDSVNPSEYCQIKFDASDDELRVFTESVGEVSARTMAFFAENANYHQLDLLANVTGDVKSLTSYTNTVGGTNHALFIDNTGKIGEEPSALRFKENIRPIEHSERIYQMEPVTYDRKDGSAYDQVGLIAEEVAVIWPELAIHKTERILEERPDEMDPNTTDNYLVGYREMDILSGIRSERLIFPLIEEMKKLRARIEELEAEVEKLK